MILAKESIKLGGCIEPLILGQGRVIGPSLSNPTIYIDEKDIIVNIRNLNYVLYHSEKNKFENLWGPLCYLHKEDENKLITHNIICKVDENLKILNSSIVDTSMFDVEPMWEFIGLEDGRLVKWNEKLYLSGVRRDTTTNGVGRMELSELLIKKEKVIETSRLRIPAPGRDDSYCEKNWMPVLDMPYTYIKWTDPTEVVKVDPSSKSCETIYLGEKKFNTRDLRGGSQVILIDGFYIAIVHEVNLFNSEAGKKNAVYRHRFVVWNKNFELLETSESFSFMGADIEFCCGVAEHGDSLLITFGFQDNAAYIMRSPKKILKRLLKSYE